MFNPYRRLWFLFLGTLILFGLLAARLIDLQVFRSSYYEAVAASQRKRASELTPHRGTIYVSEGKNKELFPIATNQRAWIAYAIPRDIENPGAVADQLAPALQDFRQRQSERIADIINATGQTKPQEDQIESEQSDASSKQDETDVFRQQLFDKFNQRADPYEPFLKQYEVLDDEFRRFLEESQLPGIALEEQEVRIYPEETLAAHVLGYVGFEDERRIGRYGVEGYLEEELAGDLGWLSTESDTRGRFIGIGGREFLPAQDGADVILTIDRVVQAIIENELADGVKRFGAERGSVIVMNPKTGAVLGMATYPTYDPNYYYAINDPAVQTNPVVSDLFEPGSILKPIIMAGAIEEGIIAPNTTFEDNGPVRVAEYIIDTFDGKHYGRQTMTQVLEQSNNVGMVWVGQQVGAEILYDFLRRFGMGEKTGIELEGETQSSLPEPFDWNVTTVATASFGQGVALTPLQALNGISAIANNGQLTQPYIVSRISRSDESEEVHQPTTVRRIISETTAARLSAMLVSVIENGVASLAKVPGYYLAGKTGTAQVPDERGRYSEDQKIISFVGYGPVADPQFSILIKLDNPAGLSFASGTAAPMFKNIASKLLNYYQIPPDYDASVKQPAFQVPSQSTEPDA